MFTDIARETTAMYLEASPWLILGIVAAGLIQAFVPAGLLSRWLGKDAKFPIVKAAIIGAPLPLCSCGVLPTAVGLRREGASKGATVSFLIATPETGPDSVAVSYALLGPVMAVARPIAAVLSAIVAGLLTNMLTRGEGDEAQAPPPTAQCCAPKVPTIKPATVKQPWPKRTADGIRYAFTDILDDIALWLVIGLIVAGVLVAFVPPLGLADIGGGLPAMLVMLVVGVPLYVCATASTPIAAGLIAAGVSPGAALVFLLAGPATNVATLGVVGKDLGPRALVGYLGGIAISALAMGLGFDALLSAFDIDIVVQMEASAETIPERLKLASGLILAPFFGWSLYKEARTRLSS